MRPNKLLKTGIAAFLAVSAVFASPGAALLPCISTQASAAAAKLDAPYSITASGENDKIVLKWSTVRGANAYRVYIYDTAAKTYKDYKIVSKPKCVVSGLKKNTTYKFIVSSMLKVGSKYYEHNKSDVIEAKTTNYKFPSAPSKKYTGFAASGGKKYYFEKGKAVYGTTKKINGRLYLFGADGALAKNGRFSVGGEEYCTDSKGVVKCSQWISEPDNVYFYANSKGKLKEYSLCGYGRTAGNLRIDGQYVEAKDLPMYGKVNGRCCYIMVGGDIYRIYLSSGTVYTAIGEDELFRNSQVFDIRTGKQIANFCGYPCMFENFRAGNGTKLFNSLDGTIWSIDMDEKITKTEAGDIVVVLKKLTENATNKTDLRIEYYNNTGKTITSVIFTVCGVDEAGNKIRYAANTEPNMYLLDNTKLANRKGAEKEWYSIINSAGLNDIVIESAKVTFEDGTSKKISADKISQIFR